MDEKQEILNTFFSGNRQLPTAPVLYLKFNQMIEDSLTSNKQIADLVMKDQSMVTKLLNLANSAMYAKRQEITNLTSAITFLGLDTLKHMILQISLVRVFKFEDDELPEFSINTFWEHSLGTAYFAELIAKKLKIPYSESYYIGGLLHDIGKLVVYQFYPERFKEIVLRQINDKAKDIEAEEDILGVNHTEIGVYFGEKWSFKPEIIETIRDHHLPGTSLALHVNIIRLANMFAKTAGLCFPWDIHALDMMGDTSWQALSQYTPETVDIAGLVTGVMEEAPKIKDSVKELLGENG